MIKDTEKLMEIIKNKDEVEKLSASALLQIVSLLVPPPVGLFLPVLGMVAISAIQDSKQESVIKEIQEQIDRLKDEQQNEIKNTLKIIIDKYENKELFETKEISEINAMCISLRLPISKASDEDELLKRIAGYIKSDSTNEDIFELEDYWDEVCVSSFFIDANEIIFTLHETKKREEINEFLENINRIIKRVDEKNGIKSIMYY